jgi:selT/selW/selH-like putative selenoprotein
MESLSLHPYADGRFEVYIDDDRVYSKLETGDFPDEATLVAKIRKRVG